MLRPLSDINKQTFLVSWSGGKDACLAMHRCIEAGGTAAMLITMLEDNGNRSRGHALPPRFLQAQAEAIGAQSITAAATWQGYRVAFEKQLRAARKQNITTAVFGDIDLDGHRVWVEDVCKNVGLHACEPLWQMSRRAVVDEFIHAGYTAVIIAVRENVLDRSFLGRTFTEETIHDLEKAGVDPAGEDGDFHTVVVNGPSFAHPIPYVLSDHFTDGGYHYAQIQEA